MDAPPSFTTAIARNSDQQQPQVIQPYHYEENHYTPSMSEIRSLENKSHPDLSFEAGSVLPRAIVQPTETFDAGGQALSIGDMAVRRREIQDPQVVQVIQPYHHEESHYTPSMSEIRSLENKSHPDLSFEAGSVLPRAIVQPTETSDAAGQALSIGDMAARRRENQDPQFPDQLADYYGYGEQAPSIGSMARDGGNSQTAGGNFNYNAPPSYNDVACRDPSYTGESGGGLNLSDGNYEGVSLNKRDFAKHYPKMILKDDKFNPYR